MRAHIIGPDYSVSRVFEEYGYHITNRPDDANVVVWTGGEDISPYLYTDKPHPTSYWSDRDNYEVELFQRYKESGRVFAGICRGAQLFSALNGGSLYQNVNNHGSGVRGHQCTYTNEHGEEETNHVVTSVHHQMCNPYTSDKRFEIWGTAREATFRDSETVERRPITNEDHPDIEIMWWPETRSYGFQGHPEYRHKMSADLFFRGLDRALAYKD